MPTPGRITTVRAACTAARTRSATCRLRSGGHKPDGVSARGAHNARPHMMKYINLVGYVSIVGAFIVHYFLGHGQSWEPGVTFALAGPGVIPLAHLMGESTEVLSAKAGPTWGGLLNATFGNAA